MEYADLKKYCDSLLKYVNRYLYSVIGQLSVGSKIIFPPIIPNVKGIGRRG